MAGSGLGFRGGPATRKDRRRRRRYCRSSIRSRRTPSIPIATNGGTGNTTGNPGSTRGGADADNVHIRLDHIIIIIIESRCRCRTGFGGLGIFILHDPRCIILGETIIVVVVTMSRSQLSHDGMVHLSDIHR